MGCSRKRQSKERNCIKCGKSFIGGRSECNHCKKRGKSNARTQSLGARFQRGRADARKKDREWSITREQFDILAAQPCHYCKGEYPKPKCGSGLDRIDNAQGYKIENILPCCGWCNRLRSDQLSVEEAEACVALVIAMRKIMSPPSANT